MRFKNYACRLFGLGLLKKLCSTYSIKYTTMEVKYIPALKDNYMYLLIDKASMDCAVVDPVEPDKVLSAVKEGGYKLTKVLTTHHHWDHAGGNKELLEKFGKPLEVHGGDTRIYGVNTLLKHGDMLKVGKDLEVECLFTPCHTTGHICYQVKSLTTDQPAVVFTGDTLFIGGCGRFFEGTAQQMYTALVDILGQLPGNTEVYCGHEYAVKNLEFAAKVQAGNETVQRKLDWTIEQQSKGLVSIPSSIASELETNPFMRVNHPSLLSYTKANDGVQAMATLRTEKDNF